MIIPNYQETWIEKAEREAVPVTATCLVWNEQTRKADKSARYEARDRMEAIRWCRMMQDWGKDFAIDGDRIVL